MRAREFDIQQQLFDLRAEIEEITVIVRELRRRHAAAGYDRAAARLAAAQAQVQQLSGAPRDRVSSMPSSQAGLRLPGNCSNR